MLLFIRRRGLGYGSIRGMMRWFQTPEVNIPCAEWRTDRVMPDVDPTLIVRWGCTIAMPNRWQGVPVMNQPSSIHLCNNKKEMVRLVKEYDERMQPDVWMSEDSHQFHEGEWVIRPRVHSRGRNLLVYNGRFVSSIPFDDYYARRLVNKRREFRVYVMMGRVVTVAEKHPGNPDNVAWNVAQGGRFEVLPWSQWPVEAMSMSLYIAHDLNRLAFAGVDIMEDMEGNYYWIENNSAPSLPSLSDGRVSYRQQCMARAFAYHYQQNQLTTISINSNYSGYRRYIHPAIREY